MRETIRKLLCMLLLLTMGIGVIPAPVAQAATTHGTQAVAVSLVVDASGSMAESDPEKLSLQAMQIFIDLLSPTDQIGAVRLSGSAQEIVPLQEVKSQGKEQLKKALEGKFNPDGASDFVPALELARKQLEGAPPDAKRVIIFLTDGYPEPQMQAGQTEYDETAYRKALQDQVGATAEAEIPIYTVGFGKSDEALLQEIAAATKAEAFLLSNPSEIAASFFRILTDTKRRTVTETGAAEANGETTLTFPVPAYTSQLTALILSDGSSLEAKLSGNDSGEGVFLDVNPGYALLTVSQPEAAEGRELKLTVKTNGQLQVAAARDMLFQPVILSPEEKTEYSLWEPLEIKVGFNVPLPENMRAEVKMFKNGIPDLNSYRLQPDGDIYTYLYEAVDKQGDYEVIVTVLDENGEVASLSNRFEVKDIPAVKTDVDWEGKVFKKGEQIILSSFLEKQNLRMVQNQELKLDSFELVLTDSQKQVFRTSLSDDPSQNTGDVVGGDGIYSLLYTMPEVGRYTAHVQATGTYQGEPFKVEDSLGSFEVSGRGTMGLTLTDGAGLVDRKGRVRVSLTVESQSKRTETLQLAIPEELGTLQTREWEILPGERVEKDLIIQLNQGNTLPEEFTLNVQTLDPLTVLGQNSTLQIPLKNGQISLTEKARQFISQNQLLVIVLLGALSGFIVLGYLLYYLLVLKKERTPIQLTYASLETPEDVRLVDGQTGKNSLRITFGEGEAADVFLALADPAQESFSIEIKQEATLRQAKARFLAGYQALQPLRNQIKTTAAAEPPGYLKLQGKLATKTVLDPNDTFEAGGYRFTFAPSEQNVSKNLLEGRDAFWQS